MKKGIVGLILGAFIIALFAPPAFASPGPPNANAPYQNIKDIRSTTLNDSGWTDPHQSPRPSIRPLVTSYAIDLNSPIPGVQINLIVTKLVNYLSVRLGGIHGSNGHRGN